MEIALEGTSSNTSSAHEKTFSDFPSDSSDVIDEGVRAVSLQYATIGGTSLCAYTRH